MPVADRDERGVVSLSLSLSSSISFHSNCCSPRLHLSQSLPPSSSNAFYRCFHLSPSTFAGVPSFRSARSGCPAPRPLPVLVAPRYDRARTKEKIKKTSEPAPSVHCAAYTRRGEPVVPACNGTRAADDDSMPLLFPFFLLSSAAASLSPSSP